MNGYSLTRKMRQTRQWYKLGPYEQVLYHELIAICNEEKWPGTFTCSNARLSNVLGICEGTLHKARENLVKAGLLYYKSGKDEWSQGHYSFTSTIRKNTTTSTNPSPPHKDDLSPPHEDNPSPPDEDFNKQLKQNLKPPKSPYKGEWNSKMKKGLLADYEWQKSFLLKFGLDGQFFQQLSVHIDHFLHHIIATGQEHNTQSLSAAKRRFSLWWEKNQLKPYEIKQSQTGVDTEIW